MSALSEIPRGQVSEQFERSAKPPAPKKSHKSSVVVCVRMSRSERDRLRREAKGRNLSAYVRGRLLDRSGGYVDTELAKTLAARILGQLGQSGLGAELKALREAAYAGVLDRDSELETKLDQACTDIALMRHDLIRLLGIKPE